MPPNPRSRRPKSGLVTGGAKLWRKAAKAGLAVRGPKRVPALEARKARRQWERVPA